MRDVPEHDIYQPLQTSPFGTAFWDFYQAITSIEAEFDLIFRRDGGVAVWTANRVRFYYEFAGQMGLYNTQEPAAAPAVELSPPGEIPDPVDLIVQTGAGGPAAANRTRGAGCVYTDNFVRRCLEQGKRILLVHDAPETLEPHDGLLPVTFRNFRLWGVEATKTRKVKRHDMSAQDHEFWSRVAERLTSELGVTAPDPNRIVTLVTNHLQASEQHGAVLDQLQPNASIMMTHYLRAPQIEAARKRRIWTVDYQHGIHSRYHMGYGYPGLRPEHRAVPYLPDEHWQWGKAWVSSDWWAAPLKQRVTGPDSPPSPTSDGIPFDDRPEKTLLVASSWAMADDYHRALRILAQQSPDWTFQIKLHPREKIAHYAELTNDFSNIEVISGDVDIHDAARCVRYVASICSSSLFDVLLDGCRIAVWNLPSVEYAEDLATSYDIPVLEPDGSNFLDTVAKLERQDISAQDFFYSMNAIERCLLDESLSVSASMLARPVLSPDCPPVPFGRFGVRVLKLLNMVRPARFSSNADLKTAHRFAHEQIGRSPRSRYVALRQLFAAEDSDALSAPAKIQLLSDAIDANIPTALLIAWVRETLTCDTNTTENLSKALLTKIQHTTDLASAPYRAELLEHAVLGDRAAENGEAWRAGKSAIAGLSPTLAKLANRYETFVQKSHTSYPDTRVSVNQQKSLAQDLVARLADPAPFSMIRLGDGEVYAFEPDYIQEQTQDADRARRENIWWSSRIEPAKRQILQSGVQQALRNADLLGIPSIWRLLRDLPRQLGTLRGPIDSWSATARAHFILSEELERFTNEGLIDWSTKTLVDDRCHQELFTRSGIERFLRSGRPAVLISCFDLTQINNAFEKHAFEYAIRLPPHSQVRHAVPDDAIARARMPDMIDDLLDQVGRYAETGAAFFVAGGIAGKLLIDHAKSTGGAALDIGAAADYWMGLETRGPLDFVHFSQDKDTQ